MAKAVNLPKRNILNRQAYAASARPYRVSRITPAKLFPKTQQEAAPTLPPEPEWQEPEHEYEFSDAYKSGRKGVPDSHTGYYRGVNRNDAMAFLEDKYYEGVESGEIDPNDTDWNWQGALKEYYGQYKVPEDEISRLRRMGVGDTDPTAGVPEGVSSTEGFGLISSANSFGEALDKGDIVGSVVHGASMVGKGATLPAQAFGSVLSTGFKGIQKGWSALKGALGGDDVGDTPSVGGSIPGGIGLGIGTGGMDPSHGLADIGVDPGQGFGGGGAGDGGGSPGMGAPGIGDNAGPGW